jgi:hypothetical protein
MNTTETKPTPKGAHTPGPWTHKATASLGPQYLVYPEGDSYDIAVIYDHGNTEANARLIAAAPELLEALKEMDRAHAVMCEAIPYGKFPTAKLEAAGVPSGFMSRVHAAIAKAERGA